MKKTMGLIQWVPVLLLFAILGSCAEKMVKKPNALIPAKKMEAILYDLAILNAAKNVDALLLEENNIDVMEFLYQTHGIDSISFAESDAYYASIPIQYEAIYAAVEERLREESDTLETDKKGERTPKSNKDTKKLLKQTKDSLP